MPRTWRNWGEWPASLPALLGEIALLWRERETILEREALPTASGAKIVPADAAGRVHLLDVAIDARLAALANRWSRIAGEARLMQYYGYPIADARRVRIVEPEEVEKALDGAALPEGVLDGYRIVLLPFALENTAGIGTAGEAALGAAPDTGAVSPIARRTPCCTNLATTCISLTSTAIPTKTYCGRVYGSAGNRCLERVSQVRSPAWVQSPQETFAEDFACCSVARAPGTSPRYGVRRSDRDLRRRRGGTFVHAEAHDVRLRRRVNRHAGGHLQAAARLRTLSALQRSGGKKPPAETAGGKNCLHPSSIRSSGRYPSCRLEPGTLAAHK